MKRCVLPFAVVCLGLGWLAIAPASAIEDDDGRPIIPEAGLAGWHVADDAHEDHWANVEGVIVGENADERGSILWTDEAFSDFEVTLEYQTDDEDYDSGIFLRADSHQVQIGISRSLQRDMTGCIYAPADGKGGYPGTTDDETIREHHRANAWNTLRIVVRGKRIQTFLNGEPFVDYLADTIPAEGPIGLQLHQGVHMKIRFRNLRVRALEQPAERVFCNPAVSAAVGLTDFSPGQ